MLARNFRNYNLHEVKTLDVLQVHSNNPVLQAAHSENKVTRLSYPFCFRGNTHKLLVDTRADHTMVDQVFADSQQLDRVPSIFKAVRVADSRRIAITHKMVPFSVRMGNIQVKLSRPIIAGLSHNVIAGLNWLQHNRPYINWDTSDITLNRNGVGFQIYPMEMNKCCDCAVLAELQEEKDLEDR
ncbi:hypothetical protein DSO57_1001112 [Entomophthora muscae]|uniref:Uncharacterized protein n=1 Tax=Entomophthora muscae TaxID=34485 RepID=A0ACC2SAZ2_9FUNG|nr:hypothetical protein DSO57_1001112 [Entomophthora muscae]